LRLLVEDKIERERLAPLMRTERSGGRRL